MGVAILQSLVHLPTRLTAAVGGTVNCNVCCTQALGIRDQLPNCVECEDGTKRRMMLNIWEASQRVKRNADPR